MNDSQSLTYEQMLENLKKGCGKFLPPVGSYKSCGKRQPISFDDTVHYCDDCQAKLDALLGANE